MFNSFLFFFFFQAEDGIRDPLVTGVQTCALPISRGCRVSLANASGYQIATFAQSTARPYLLNSTTNKLLKFPGNSAYLLICAQFFRRHTTLPTASPPDRKSVV